MQIKETLTLFSDGTRAWIAYGSEQELLEYQEKLKQFLNLKELLSFDIEIIPKSLGISMKCENLTLKRKSKKASQN